MHFLVIYYLFGESYFMKKTHNNNQAQNDDFPCEYTVSIIGGKWKIRIIYWLVEKGVLRYGELKRLIPNITHKMFSSQLKELEADGIINRKEYNQIPPKVEYSATEKGASLMPIIRQMCNWGKNNRDK